MQFEFNFTWGRQLGVTQDLVVALFGLFVLFVVVFRVRQLSKNYFIEIFVKKSILLYFLKKSIFYSDLQYASLNITRSFNIETFLISSN